MSETRFDVRDLAGRLVAVHVRRERVIGGERLKDFWWQLPGASKAGLGGRRSETLPLYGTERLATWPAEAPVIITEGEKAADALTARGLAALGTVTGAGNPVPSADSLAVLRGRTVILWPDHDDIGHEHMTKVGARLAGVAASVRLVTWPDAPPKGDAADWTGTTDELRAMLAAAPLASGQTAPTATATTDSAGAVTIPKAGADIAKLIRDGVAEGGRNPGALSIAGYYRHRDEPEAHAAAVVLAFAARCTPPLSEHEALAVVKSVYTRYKAGERAALDAADAEPERRAIITRLADVAPERVSWLWPGRLPLGKVAVLDGSPGLGKSTVTLDLAARVSRGHAMPDGTWSALAGPAGVVLLSAEDGPADTIRPRLEAAGADCERIALLTVADQHGAGLFTLPDDLPLLREAVNDLAARLVVVDPLMAFLAGATNSYRDQDMRRALAPLAQLADDTGAAVLVVRHFNKGASTDPLMRGGGSIGIVGAARAGLLVAPHPDDGDDPNGRRVLAVYKSNLAALPLALVYQLEDTGSGVARVAWEPEPFSISASDLLGAPVADEPRGAMDAAKSFLQDVLANGPKPARFVTDEATAAGISKRTLARARKTLGIQASKAGMHGGWLWSLPAEDHDEAAEGCHDTPKDAISTEWHPSVSLASFGPLDPTLAPSLLTADPSSTASRCRLCDRPATHQNATGAHCQAHALHEPGGLSHALATVAAG